MKFRSLFIKRHDQTPGQGRASRLTPYLALAALLFPALVSAADDDVQLTPELRLEAFPALQSPTPQSSDESLQLVGVNHEHRLLGSGFNAGSQALDLSASYVWNSPRFGQFVVSTNTSYVYNTPSETVREPGSLLPRTEPAIGLMPERQSSLTLSWQIGKHTATAVTSYSETMDQLGMLSLDKLNAEDLNELVGQITTLDLSYAYNVRAGRSGNASIALGVRNMFENKAQAATLTGAAAAQAAGSVAYGTIKYQF